MLNLPEEVYLPLKMTKPAQCTLQPVVVILGHKLVGQIIRLHLLLYMFLSEAESEHILCPFKKMKIEYYSN